MTRLELAVATTLATARQLEQAQMVLRGMLDATEIGIDEMDKVGDERAFKAKCALALAKHLLQDLSEPSEKMMACGEIGVVGRSVATPLPQN